MRRGKIISNILLSQETCTIKQILMAISGNCLPEAGKCPGKSLIALPHRPYGPIYQTSRYKLNPEVTPPVLMRNN